MRRAQLRTWAFVLPAAAYVLIFFGYPVVNNVMMSLQRYTTETFYTGHAPFVGLQNYLAVIGSKAFVGYSISTAIFTVASLTCTFVIGLALAVFFNKVFPLSGVLRALLLLPWLLPMIISAAVWRRMMDEGSGILNQILNGLGLGSVPWLTDPQVALISVIIVNVWIGIPFVMVILYGGLQEIPAEVYEAAALDGAVGWRSFAHITVPLLRPVIVVVLTLGFIYTIRVLDVVLGLTGGGPADATQMYATAAYRMSFVNFDFGHGAAFSNILIIVSLLISGVQLLVGRRTSEMAG